MDLCHLFREDLASHLTSAVINVASQSALQPVPYLIPYAAAKAFVFQFSQALHGEWLHRGILVQTLLPGPTDTRSASLKGLMAHGLFKKLASPADVVRKSLRHLKRRSPVVVHGPGPIFHRLFAALAPARIVILVLAQRFRPPQTRLQDPGPGPGPSIE
jgi:short-subunit dehydrogenase